MRAMYRRSFLPFAAATLAAPAAFAWPDQPVRLVVPFTPGTGPDIIARFVSEKLAPKLGQPVVVDNVAGASGNIGSQQVARAKPDGLTLMSSVNTLVMNPSLFRNLPYDPVTDFAPIGLTAWGSLVLVEQAAGIELLHVPYKGTAGAVQDLLGGQIGYMFLPVHVSAQYIRGGKLKAIAAGSPKRLPQLPDVPTLIEAGLVGADVDMWYGLFAPKGTPQPVVDQLNREVAAILNAPEARKVFEAQGLVPTASTPNALEDIVVKDRARWADV